mmetsp:Transcript_19262/g.54213  ORF Transcript_19262/g.54213 Transcript_19262/m.54213 type:complete len:240 (-) Transcript_19262:128-847(-)
MKAPRQDDGPLTRLLPQKSPSQAPRSAQRDPKVARTLKTRVTPPAPVLGPRRRPQLRCARAGWATWLRALRGAPTVTHPTLRIAVVRIARPTAACYRAAERAVSVYMSSCVLRSRVAQAMKEARPEKRVVAELASTVALIASSAATHQLRGSDMGEVGKTPVGICRGKRAASEATEASAHQFHASVFMFRRAALAVVTGIARRVENRPGAAGLRARLLEVVAGRPRPRRLAAMYWPILK